MEIDRERIERLNAEVRNLRSHLYGVLRDSATLLRVLGATPADKNLEKALSIKIQERVSMLEGSCVTAVSEALGLDGRQWNDWRYPK